MTKSDYIFKRKYRDELRRAILELSGDPVASVSISTPNGGSRSVSYSSLGALRDALRQVEEELAAYVRSLTDGGGIGISYTRWC